MRIEEITWTEKYKMFEVGERIVPTSRRCSLNPGIYVVTKCVAPICAGDESVVFVEGRDTGISTEYVTAVQEIVGSNKNKFLCPFCDEIMTIGEEHLCHTKL